MNYKVSRIRKDGDQWKANVLYWEGECPCTGKTEEVSIVQDARPMKRDFISSLNQ